MKIKIIPNDKGNPPGRLAEAEIHFTEGPLAGLRLIGFAVWERRGAGGKNVTFPARVYSVNSERRSFALLRPIVDTSAHDNIRAMIIQAYDEYCEQQQIAQAGSTTDPDGFTWAPSTDQPEPIKVATPTTYADRAYATPAERTQADQDEHTARDTEFKF